MMNRLLIISLLCAHGVFAAGSELAAYEQETLKPELYKDIGRQFESSYERVFISFSCKTRLEYIQKVKEIFLTEYEKKDLQATELLSGLLKSDFVPHEYTKEPAVLGSRVITDLALVNGGRDASMHSVTHQTGCAQTVFGRLSFASLLGAPLTSIDALKKRQDAIRFFLDFEGRTEEIAQCAKTIVENERALALTFGWFDLTQWGDIADDASMGLSGLIPKRLKNTFGLASIGSALNFVGDKLLAHGDLITLTSIMLYLYRQYSAKSDVGSVEEGSETPRSRLFSWFREDDEKERETFKMYADKPEVAFFGVGYGKKMKWIIEKMRANPKTAGLALATLYLLVRGRGLYYKLQTYYSYILAVPFFVKHVRQLAAALAAIEKAYSVVASFPVLRTLPDLAPLCEFFEKKVRNDHELRTIFSMANSFHLKTAFSPFSVKAGQIMNSLIRERKDDFIEMFAAYGRLETYAGAAQLYKEQKDSSTPYCFAQYSDSEKPLYVAKTIWHPLIGRNKAIGSDVAFGDAEKTRMLILTGANEGGKSGFLKSVPMGAIFAQTLGIVPAQECTIAPFHVIETYLNITDNVAKGHSLFRAEAVRARELIERITPQEGMAAPRALIVFDELFNGTSFHEASALSYAVASHLAKYDSACSVFATHFPYLTNLAGQHQGIENVCVLMKRDEEGEMRPTYKINKGISDQHVALDVLRREGVSGDIMDDAQRVLKTMMAEGS
jgi:hypothetical protein